MKPTFPILAAVAVAAAGGWYAFSGTNAVNSTPINPLVSAANAQSADTTEADAPAATTEIQDMTLGNPDSAVQIIEYASYTCPHCASFLAYVFKRLTDNSIATGKVKFVYREVYFDKYGLWAAMVARCGGEMRYFGINAMLYEQQKEWIAGGKDAMEIVKNLRTIGKKAGLSDADLDICMNDGATAQAMVANFEVQMKEYDVSGTPTLIINGEKNSNMSYEALAAKLDAALAG